MMMGRYMYIMDPGLPSQLFFPAAVEKRVPRSFFAAAEKHTFFRSHGKTCFLQLRKKAANEGLGTRLYK